MLRRARELLAGPTRGAVRFPRQSVALFADAIHCLNGYGPGTWTDSQLDAHRAPFDDRLLELVTRPRAVPESATLAKHLWNHFEQWFAFVFDPRIEPINWRAEQAIRPAVVNRKVSGGNRTAAGAQARGVLMSVFEACRRQTLAAVDHVSQTLRWFGNRLPAAPDAVGASNASHVPDHTRQLFARYLTGARWSRRLGYRPPTGPRPRGRPAPSRRRPPRARRPG